MSDENNDYQKDMTTALNEWVSKLGEKNKIISSEVDMHQVDLGYGRHQLYTVHVATWEEPGATWEENRVEVTEEMRKIVLDRMRLESSESLNHGDS